MAFKKDDVVLYDGREQVVFAVRYNQTARRLEYRVFYMEGLTAVDSDWVDERQLTATGKRLTHEGVR